jgi:RNA polymerase sigma factor (sigma-70 family)
MDVVHLLDRSPLRDLKAASRPSPSDEELLEGSVACPEQFVTLYDRHAPGLLAFFGRRTNHAQVAAHQTPQTIAQAFAARTRFRDAGAGAATAWLYTIARRQLSRFVRRQRVESQWRRRFGMEQLLVAPDALERAEELIDLGKVRDHVAEALDGLKGDIREAVVLRVVDGMSYSEAACLAGCSEALMRQRVSRGLKRLARDLAVLRDDPGEVHDRRL